MHHEENANNNNNNIILTTIKVDVSFRSLQSDYHRNKQKEINLIDGLETDQLEYYHWFICCKARAL